MYRTIAAAACLLILCACAQAADSAAGRLSPALRALAETPSEARVPVMVLMRGPGDVSSLLVDAHTVDVAGMRLVRGLASPRVLLKIAGHPGVEAVVDAGPRQPPAPPDPDLPPFPKPVDVRMTRAALAAAPAWKPSALLRATKPPADTPDSWWGNGFIGVHEAWDLGYDGAGVMVAVMDTGVDFAHPDLAPAIARVDNPASPHHGWPICFDGYSMNRFALEGPIVGSRFVSTTTAEATIYGATATAPFATWKKDHYETHTFTFWNESISGVYRFGLHPDLSLVEMLGEYPAVLVVDATDTANHGPSYNTVYVDMDADYDFTDEKPCFRGDEVAWRDTWNASTNSAGSDGYPDVSAGMVYFIADGVRPIPAGDWLYHLPVPAPGTLVLFMLNDVKAAGAEHGTLCASAVAAQGIVNGNAPPYKPAYAGPGDGMVQGPARGAGIISIGDVYQGGYYPDYYLFCALGYDGQAGTGDEPNIVSMSFGNGAIDEDGWDFESRLIEWVGRTLALDTSWLISSGNGAPGYMTVTSPNPPRSVKVGASTQYGSTLSFDSIVDVTQINAGDVQSWSGAGPAANGHAGVDVLANGAWGTGDLPLNQVHNGWTAWNSWGGTSRSCPEAAGVLALVYQAFKAGHQRWPTADEAKQLLMNSAVDEHYDVFRQGAGRVHAGRAVRLAARLSGASVDPPQWWAGDYRGVRYDAFARIVHPGQVLDATFTVVNVGAQRATLDVSDVEPGEIGRTEFAIHTVKTPAEDRLVSQPDYLYLLEGPGAANIPEHTDLMTVEAVFPFEDFDLDYVTGATATVKPGYENGYRLLAYDWLDRDGDGKLYDDSLGQIPGVVEQSEIQPGEYLRFNYGYTTSTSLKCFVREPHSRMHDGLYIGLQHRKSPTDGRAVDVSLRARYFRDRDCAWLSEPAGPLSIAAGAAAVLSARITVAATQPLGCYAAKLLLSPRGGAASDVVVVPVVVNVAADWMGQPLALGGGPPEPTPYDNSRVRGDFSWGDRAESGDARLFFVDVPAATPGGFWLARSSWQDDLPTDVDTLVFGPAADAFSTPGDAYYLPVYGPGTLLTVGGQRSPGRPDWRFSTSSGGAVDYCVGPMTSGLHTFFVQNVLFSGRRFDAPFRVDVGSLAVQPSPLRFRTLSANLTADVTLTSSLPLPGLSVEVYGPTPALSFLDQPIAAHDIGNVKSVWTYRFQISQAGVIDLSLSSSSPAVKDLDLYLYRDGADGSVPDGVFRYPQEVVGSSAGLSADERIVLSLPPDGDYLAGVYGFTVEGIGAFDLAVGNAQGTGAVGVSPSPVGDAAAGQPKGMRLATALPQPGEYRGYLVLGPAESPRAVALALPITLYYPGDADGNGVVDEADYLAWPQYWHSNQEVPVGLDVDGNGVFNADDAVRLVPPVRGKPGRAAH